MKRLLSALVLVLLVSAGCKLKTVRLDETGFLARATFDPERELVLIHPGWVPEGYRHETLELERADGTIGRGVRVMHPENDVTVLYFCGNGSELSNAGYRVFSALTRSHVDVVFFDRRGYGGSSGSPSMELTMEDTVQTFDFVRAMVDGELIVHGLSLGSFAAGVLAERRPVDGLVLEGSATNVDEWKDLFVSWYVRPFVKIEISEEMRLADNLRVVRNQQAPLLILVGSRDGLTPVRFAERLFGEAVAEEKWIHVFEGSYHNTIMSHPEFNAVYDEFLAELVDA
jgi:pimeloyl-ACP methyl ester carboxylesterase